MALRIEHPEADRLARELAARTGEGITAAVIIALQERLDRTSRRPSDLQEEILRIGRDCAALPLLDARSADAILGYENGGVTT